MKGYTRGKNIKDEDGYSKTCYISSPSKDNPIDIVTLAPIPSKSVLSTVHA